MKLLKEPETKLKKDDEQSLPKSTSTFNNKKLTFAESTNCVIQ